MLAFRLGRRVLCQLQILLVAGQLALKMFALALQRFIPGLDIVCRSKLPRQTLHLSLVQGVTAQHLALRELLLRVKPFLELRDLHLAFSAVWTRSHASLSFFSLSKSCWSPSAILSFKSSILLSAISTIRFASCMTIFFPSPPFPSWRSHRPAAPRPLEPSAPAAGAARPSCSARSHERFASCPSSLELSFVVLFEGKLDPYVGAQVV